jgi:hypothetical protein
LQQIVEVAGPADRNGHTGDAIFQNQIPAGQPGQELAEGQDDAWTGAGPMGITDNGRSDQHEDPCPDDGPNAETGQIPSGQGFFEPVGGMVRVRQDLFDRFDPEQMADHRAPFDGRRSRRRPAEDIFGVHLISSIAGAVGG